MKEWITRPFRMGQQKSAEGVKEREGLPQDAERVIGSALTSFINAAETRKMDELYPVIMSELRQYKDGVVRRIMKTMEYGSQEEQAVPFMVLELAAIRAREAAAQIDHRHKYMYEGEGEEVLADDMVGHLSESSKREEFLKLMDAIRSRAGVVERIYTEGDFMEWLGEVRKKIMRRLEAMKLDKGTKEALEDRIDAIGRFLEKESNEDRKLIRMVLREDINYIVFEAEKRLVSVLGKHHSPISQKEMPRLLEELLKREQMFIFVNSER